MKNLLFALTGLFTLLLSSCINTDEKIVPGPAGNNRFQLHVTSSELEVELAKTRATVAPEPGEDMVADLFLLFFKPAPSNGGEFLDYVKVAGPFAMNSKIDIDLTKTTLNVTDPYHILAIANIEADNRPYLNGMSIEQWMQQWAGKSEREVMTEAIAWSAGSVKILPNALLMNGRVDKGEKQFLAELVLNRNQVRFDVYNNTRESHDLVSVEIRNAYPSSSIWNRGSMDYSDAIGRIQEYYRYNNSANLGADGADGNGPILKDISGFLYAFENQVPMPVQNDRNTTALIIGLKERANGSVTYYRVNIAPANDAQMLKRNNVYRVTINNVGDSGASTPQDAYNYPENNRLDYAINYWDLDNNGVIIQDGSSILSIPSKTVRFEREGGASSYSIFTFTNSTNPVSPLSIRSQVWEPSNGQIVATLNGNNLVISATPLTESETKRSGKIVLGYAGLEASIEVIQSAAADESLEVHIPGGKIPCFAPFGGIASDWIRVQASGDWTAEIFMESTGGFSFRDIAIPVTKISSSKPEDSDVIINNKFRIFTSDANRLSQIREAFVIVTLDKDPVGYAHVFRVTQAASGGINIVPNQTSVTFNGMGTGLASIADNTVDTFNVRPSEITDEMTSVVTIAGWSYTILQSGSNDDRTRFEVTNELHSTTDSNNNKFTVRTTGENMTGRQYTATLRVYLTDIGSGNNDPHMDITLVQQSVNLDFSSNTLPAIATKGGRTQPVSILTEPSLKWSASIKTDSGTSTDGRKLVQHEAKLVDQNGNPIVSGNLYDLSTQFSVEFPKVYYPNREIPISATVTVTVGGITKTITVSQTTLTPRQVVSYNLTGSAEYWGELSMDGGRYNQAWTSAVWAIPGHPTTTPTGALRTATIPANVTYLHVVPQEANGANAQNWNWASVNDFMKNRDAFTVFLQQSNSRDAINNANSPVKKAGYQNVTYASNGNNAKITDKYSSTKVYQFLMGKGNKPLTLSDSDMVNDFWMDGIHTVIPTPWPASAVVMMTKNDNANNATLIIDVENGFLYIGESQMFWQNGNGADNLRPWGQKFLDNLMFYIANASRYGSHFTDLLIEEGRPGAMPAPWDNYWGANKGVPTK